jgi:hypothetical protein
MNISEEEIQEIENYIFENNQLNPVEKQTFEKKLAENAAFNAHYKATKAIITGINKTQTDAEIDTWRAEKSKKAFIFKMAASFAVGLLICSAVYILNKRGNNAAMASTQKVITIPLETDEPNHGFAGNPAVDSIQIILEQAKNTPNAYIYNDSLRLKINSKPADLKLIIKEKQSFLKINNKTYALQKTMVWQELK